MGSVPILGVILKIPMNASLSPSRMIAYVFAVAERESDAMEGEPLVLQAIRGQADDMACGSAHLQRLSKLDEIVLYSDKVNGLLIEEVQLSLA